MKKLFLFTLMLVLLVGFTYGQRITITSPVAGDYSQSDTLRIVWTVSGITGNVKINLRKADGSGGTVLQESYSAINSPYSFPLASVVPGDYFIKIKQGSVFGKSQVFTVNSLSRSIRVTHPNGGEKFIKKGATISILWTASGTSNPFMITLWKNNERVGIIHRNFAAGNGRKTLNWEVGKVAGEDASSGPGYKIKVEEKNAPETVADMSDRIFMIQSESFRNLGDGHHDLELTDIEYNYRVTIGGKKGWLDAKIRSNNYNFRGNVRFGVLLHAGPELREYKFDFVKNLNLTKGRVQSVALWHVNKDLFPLKGRNVTISVDNRSTIRETNKNNNSRTRKLTVFDVKFARRGTPAATFRQTRSRIGNTPKWLIRYSFGVVHNYHRTIRQLQVQYTLESPEGNTVKTHTFENIRPNTPLFFEDQFWLPVPNRQRSYKIKVWIDPRRKLRELEEANNTATANFDTWNY